MQQSKGSLNEPFSPLCSYRETPCHVWYEGPWTEQHGLPLCSSPSAALSRELFFPPLCLLLSNISFCLSLVLTSENVPMCCLHWIFERVPTGQLVLLAFWPRLMRREEKDLDSGLQKLKPPHFSSSLINSLVYLPVTMTNDTTSWCYHIWQSHPGFELIN